MDSLTLEIPALPPGLNGSKGLMRLHFHAYGDVRDAWVSMVRAARGTNRRVFGPCSVTMERHYCGRPLDCDNAFASAKVPLDALRKAGVLRDDDPESVTSLSVRQVRVPKRKDERTVIRIEQE